MSRREVFTASAMPVAFASSAIGNAVGATLGANAELKTLLAEFETLLAELALRRATDSDLYDDDIYSQIDDINERIRAIRPRSIDDLIIKARILQWDAGLDPDLTVAPEQWDWDVKCMQSFVSDLCCFGAVGCDWR